MGTPLTVILVFFMCPYIQFAKSVRILPAKFSAVSFLASRMSHIMSLLLQSTSTLTGILRLSRASAMLPLLTPTNFLVLTSVVSREIVLLAIASITEGTDKSSLLKMNCWYWPSFCKMRGIFLFGSFRHPKSCLFISCRYTLAGTRLPHWQGVWHSTTTKNEYNKFKIKTGSTMRVFFKKQKWSNLLNKIMSGFVKKNPHRK